VHHIHGVIEEWVGVLYSTTDNDHNCWGLAPHVHTYVCIWAKTGEYLAFFLAFVDL